jgi:hypothetical protein
MANQMIALGVRAPQAVDLGGAATRYSNMMTQRAQMEAYKQDAASKQLEREQKQALSKAYASSINPQTGEIDQAALIKNLQASGLGSAIPGALDDIGKSGKSRADAKAADLAYIKSFNDTAIKELTGALSPDQAVAAAGRLKARFSDLGGKIDELMQTMPKDPALYEPWRQEQLFHSMEADKQLSTDLTTQNLGTSTRILSTPKYRPGAAATVVPGSEAAIAPDLKPMAVEGLGVVGYDPATNTYTPATSGGASFGGGGGIPGPRSGNVGNPADAVFGFGKFGQPSAPLSSLPMGDVQSFQRDVLIPQTRGKVGAGADKGTGAVGAYQITYGTLKDYGPRVFGANWRTVPFTAANQDKLGAAIWEDVKHGNIHDTWAGMPNNRPGTYSNTSWDQIKDTITQKEIGKRGAAPSAPATQGMTTADMAAENTKRRAAQAFLETAGVNLKTGADPVEKLIKSSTGGAVEALGANIIGAIPENWGGGATAGAKAIGELETIAAKITTDILGGKLGTGISNEDRNMIQRMVGDIADPNIPVGKRLAAWQRVKGIQMKYLEANPSAPATRKADAPKSGWGKAAVVGD